MGAEIWAQRIPLVLAISKLWCHEVKAHPFIIVGSWANPETAFSLKGKWTADREGKCVGRPKKLQGGFRGFQGFGGVFSGRGT